MNSRTRRADQDERGISRRRLLDRAAAVAAVSTVAAAVGSPTVGAAAAAPTVGLPACGPVGPVSITPGDPRYPSMLLGDNFRFVG